MTQTGLENFDKSVQKTMNWINQLKDHLGEDRSKSDAYHALRGVLQALRDRMTVEDAANFGAQLPMLVRGFYYEDYSPANKPLPIRDREEFFDYVRDRMQTENVDPESAVESVVELLEENLTEGEMRKVAQNFPEPLRELF